MYNDNYFSKNFIMKNFFNYAYNAEFETLFRKVSNSTYYFKSEHNCIVILTNQRHDETL